MVVWMEKIGGEIHCRHQDHKLYKRFIQEQKKNNTNACNRIEIIVGSLPGRLYSLVI